MFKWIDCQAKRQISRLPTRSGCVSTTHIYERFSVCVCVYCTLYSNCQHHWYRPSHKHSFPSSLCRSVFNFSFLSVELMLFYCYAFIVCCLVLSACPISTKLLIEKYWTLAKTICAFFLLTIVWWAAGELMRMKENSDNFQLVFFSLFHFLFIEHFGTLWVNGNIFNNSFDWNIETEVYFRIW